MEVQRGKPQNSLSPKPGLTVRGSPREALLLNIANRRIETSAQVGLIAFHEPPTSPSVFPQPHTYTAQLAL